MAKDKKFSWLEDEEDTNSELETFDANWNKLQNWDSIIAIKDLPVKWWKGIKRWDKFKNIRLTDEVWVVESGNMVLKTEFFKKA